MSTEQNKALIRQTYEECFGKNPDLIDQYFAEDYVHHSDRWRNRDELRAILRQFYNVYDEIQWTTELMVAEDDRVAVLERTVCKGGGGEHVIMATLIYRIRDGKITDSWGYSNSFF